MHSSPAPSTGPDRIRLRGARLHNLRDVDLDLPREAIVAVTGVSGNSHKKYRTYQRALAAWLAARNNGEVEVRT